MAITWHDSGTRKYEVGVEKGVLYPISDAGAYTTGVAWNGLSAVNESPSGAEETKVYADNIKYLGLMSAEEYAATIEAYYYPDEFAECNGEAELTTGVAIGQQTRKKFGFSYVTKLGNEVMGENYGYILHLVYGCVASPSERNHQTINDSPEASAMSWEVSTTPVEVGTINGVAYKPTATVNIDSTKVNATKLAALEGILYGSNNGDGPRLPLPGEIYTLFSAGATGATGATSGN